MNDKRRHKRFNSLHLVSYKLFNDKNELCGQGVGRTLNISQGGILLEIEDKLDDEVDAVHMEIALDDTLIIISGAVTFTRKTNKGFTECGVKFQRISPGSLEMLLSYIRDFFGEKGRKIGLLRSKKTRIDNVVLELSNEHKIITDYAITCREMLEGFSNEYLTQTLSTLFSYMENDLNNHFNFEEQVLFQAALSGTSTDTEIPKLVKEFNEDHAWFLTEVEHISSQLKSLLKGQKNIDDIAKGRIEIFMARLKAHSRKEMKDLFPLIDNDEDKIKALNRLMD
ncbi:hemerythrin domain-containing protein [Desulforegula conservatrix]|uniref:hemerythrin domain-containing protein n=1 Tax=Desulforegula conservatrix TaxID=153026 RepID=UPI000418C64F|nr:hemerythrin domain-containing protein [Desulforegula conservatrix]